MKELIHKTMGRLDLVEENILFAVNMDMDDWIMELNTIREFFPDFAFGCQQDGLSYLRQHALGVSVP